MTLPDEIKALRQELGLDGLPVGSSNTDEDATAEKARRKRRERPEDYPKPGEP